MQRDSQQGALTDTNAPIACCANTTCLRCSVPHSMAHRQAPTPALCLPGDSLLGSSSGAAGQAACQAEPGHTAFDGSPKKGGSGALPDGCSPGPGSPHAAVPT